jgi:hypothetical protein
MGRCVVMVNMPFTTFPLSCHKKFLSVCAHSWKSETADKQFSAFSHITNHGMNLVGTHIYRPSVKLERHDTQEIPIS